VDVIVGRYLTRAPYGVGSQTMKPELAKRVSDDPKDHLNSETSSAMVMQM
jgi:hypothetical protein